MGITKPIRHTNPLMKEGDFMQENNLKGLWIPYEILSNESLNDKEKLIWVL